MSEKTSSEAGCVSDSDPIKTCPWCQRLAMKDEACNYVVCGRTENGPKGFVAGPAGAHGCARAWCFQCGGKLCGPPMYDMATGNQLHASEDHNHTGQPDDIAACNGVGYCSGGHNSHKI